MLRPTEAKAEEARKKARELFQRDRAKEQEVVKEREKAFEAQSHKTAKLKALRLARDAQQEAAALEAKAASDAAKASAKAAAKPAAKKARKAV
jgi:hypothetical protein